MFNHKPVFVEIFFWGYDLFKLLWVISALKNDIKIHNLSK